MTHKVEIPAVKPAAVVIPVAAKPEPKIVPIATVTLPPQPAVRPTLAEPVKNGPSSHPQAEVKAQPQPPIETPPPAQPVVVPAVRLEALSSLEKSISLLHQHQAETMRAHETYLHNQRTYAENVFHLMRQVYTDTPVPVVDNLPAPAAPVAPVESVAVVAVPPVVVPVEPTPAPVVPAAVAPVVVEPVKPTPVAPVVAAPAPVAVAAPGAAHPAAPQVGELSLAMLAIVSEKTGYPTEMLDLGMDMEADLGIDSIKRVEILGAMQDRYPELPAVNPEALAELRTLGQIVEHMQGGAMQGGATVAPTPAAPAVMPAPVPVVAASSTPVAAPAAAPVAELSQAMLAIVSEKTGYPTEMLDLGMDMEADLGIDSIKRVEILGAMQDRYPELPAVNPEALAELRTLGQIVAHMQGGVTVAPAPAAPAVVAAPASVAVASTPAAAPVAELSQAMLAIVSEKTGYPAEMLDLGMDMEADLGIDSIKRVEILGAMQDRYPELPAVNPEALAELRTLGQIVEHMQGGAIAAPAPVAPVVAAPAPVAHLNGHRNGSSNGNGHVNGNGNGAGFAAASLAELEQAMLAVVSEKTAIPPRCWIWGWIWRLTSASTRSSGWRFWGPCRSATPICRR
jgi:acyl carrier protein